MVVLVCVVENCIPDIAYVNVIFKVFTTVPWERRSGPIMLSGMLHLNALLKNTRYHLLHSMFYNGALGTLRADVIVRGVS